MTTPRYARADARPKKVYCRDSISYLYAVGYADDEVEELNWVGRKILEWIFEAMVEDGDIRIDERSVAEILKDFLVQVAAVANSPEFEQFEIQPSLDYRNTLRQKALAERRDGNDLISIMHYSTWFEHFVNGLLSHAFTRSDYPGDYAKLLLRELRVPTKATALWMLAGLPPISDGDLKLMDQAAAIRNGFVHYKWSPVSQKDEQRVNRQNAELAARLDGVAERLLAIENEALWSGREEEIIEAFRAFVAEVEQERGPLGAAILANHLPDRVEAVPDTAL
jgi:hypothetical protein